MTPSILGLGMLSSIVLNSINVTDEGWFVIQNNDPFIIVTVPKKEKFAYGVFLDFEMKKYPKAFGSQMFYSTDFHGFDKKFAYTFELSGINRNKIYVPLDRFENEWIEKIRWDFDECDKCEIKINDIKFVQNKDEAEYLEYIPRNYRWKRYRRSRDLSGREKGLSIQDFHIDGFKHLGGSELKVVNNSPFIVSPLLDYPLSQAAGIFFKFRVPLKQNDTIYFKLGWRTYKYGFRDKARLRLERVDKEYIEIFFPFTPLNGEKVVRRIRLWFEPDIGDNWFIEDIKIIPTRLVEKYSIYQPTSYIDYPAEPAKFYQLIKEGLRKFYLDPLFLIAFLMIILTLVGFLVLVIRKK